MAESGKERRRSIAQINRMLRSIVEAETLEQYFWAGGRIDRYFRSDRGHIYFDLVDDYVRIRCFLREERASKLSLDLRNHLDVDVYGDIHFYDERSEAQINVLDLRLAGKSAAAEPAIERLRALGLYPPTKAMPPANIRRVGLITSRSSRAIGDFENAYQSAGERGVLAPVSWKYVMLEGERALQSIVDAIHAWDKEPEIDLIAIIRGGGRSENLAIFDSFEIARAIIQCDTFVVTGIGHHKDSALADDVADYAASTPTAVAHYLADLILQPAEPGQAEAPPYHYQPEEWPPYPEDVRYDWRPRADPPPAETAPQPPSKRLRLVDAAIVVLLIAAIASVLFLIAVVISQMP